VAKGNRLSSLGSLIWELFVGLPSSDQGVDDDPALKLEHEVNQVELDLMILLYPFLILLDLIKSDLLDGASHLLHLVFEEGLAEGFALRRVKRMLCLHGDDVVLAEERLA
jgi:hypothetical protein